jgi:hypothetical protein
MAGTVALRGVAATIYSSCMRSNMTMFWVATSQCTAVSQNMQTLYVATIGCLNRFAMAHWQLQICLLADTYMLLLCHCVLIAVVLRSFCEFGLNGS